MARWRNKAVSHWMSSQWPRRKLGTRVGHTLVGRAPLLWFSGMQGRISRAATAWLVGLWLSVLGCAVTGWPSLVDPGLWLLRWQSPEAKLEAFRRAWMAYSRGAHGVAARDFSRLAVVFPDLADHALYLAGEAAWQLGRKQDARVFWRRLGEQFRQSVRFAEAALGVARIELERGRLDEARSWALRALPAGDKRVQQTAQLVLAMVEERQGKGEEAAKVYRTLWKNARPSPLGAEAKAAWLKFSEQHPTVRENPSELLEGAGWALEEHDLDLAQRLADEAVRLGGPPLAPGALRVAAEVAYKRGQQEEAWRLLWAVAHRYPETKEAPKALLRLGSLLWNADRDTAADRVFDELVQRYPMSDEAARARIARARISLEKQDFGHALAQLEPLGEPFVAPGLKREALWWQGRIEWERKNFAAAARAFARLGENDPAAVYWQARSEEALGRLSTAARLYARVREIDPGYYALMASRRSAGVGSVPVRMGVPVFLVSPPEAEPDLSFADPFHLRRWTLLRKGKMKDLATGEALALLAATDARDPARRRALLEALALSDAYREMVSRARAWVDLDETTRNRGLYPLAFWQIVQTSAAEFRVDPLLLLAVMRQESLFDPGARSPVGARGLMQLMPATAEQLALSLGMPAVDRELENPAVNVRLGARYLRQLLDRYQDDLLKALAAYNGGERATDRWAALAYGREPDEFVERVSYRETREYVKQVVSHYAWYVRIYTSSSPAERALERGVGLETP